MQNVEIQHWSRWHKFIASCQLDRQAFMSPHISYQLNNLLSMPMCYLLHHEFLFSAINLMWHFDEMASGSLIIIQSLVYLFAKHKLLQRTSIEFWSNTFSFLQNHVDFANYLELFYVLCNNCFKNIVTFSLWLMLN